MRDILNILEQLNESTGLAGRKAGDTFRNPAGDEIVFSEIKFFPEEGGKYTKEQMDEALAGVEAQAPNIQWQNNRTGRSGGFAVVSFSIKDSPMFIGRYMESIKISAKENFVPNVVGDYRFAGKAAAKAHAGLSPQDLLTQKIDLSASDIMNQLAESLGTDHPLYAVAHRIASGEKFPLIFKAPPNISFTSFRDYFCEILQPIALQQGQWVGNAAEAAEIFLGGSFQNTLISFDMSKTAGLSDSIMSTEEGKFVKISSKGGGGAYASAKNLLDSVNELKESPKGDKLLKKYADVIEMMTQIQKAGQAGAPLMLGIKYKIIDEDDANMIRSLKNTALVNLDNLSNTDLSPTLKKLAKERKTDNPEQTNLYYHLMAAVAFKAADAVNDRTNFSKAAADILNNGALVQVYTTAKEGKDTWTLKPFDTIYPGESIKGVYLSASKTYYSTNIKGNFTFKIDRGHGKPKDENVDTSAGEAPELDLSKASKEITRPKRKKAEPDSGVGRELRPK